MINVVNLKRSFDAASRDRAPYRFWNDFRQALQSKQLRPEEFSIRKLFEAFVADGRELAEELGPQSGGMPLLESAVDTSAFANISGQVVYSAVMEAFESEPFVFAPLVRTINTQFSGERIPGVGRLGDAAEEVGEGQPYPSVGLGQDWIETPQTTKRGFVVPVTREAIFFDRTHLVLQRAAEVGEFLALNKEKRIIDCLIDENSVEHRYNHKGAVHATYQATSPWVNVLGSNGLAD